jgi:hypothetical protein
MRSVNGLVIALTLGLTVAGCVFTSGQIRVDFDLPDATASNLTGIYGYTIDLSTQKEYQDNKDKIKTLSDLAILGKITNNSINPVDVEFWITKTPTAIPYTDDTSLKADPSAVMVWGPLHLAPAGQAGDVVTIDWNKSTQLFTAAGKQALIDEARGDGQFTAYAIGHTGTYNFDVKNGALVLTLDTGI